LNLRYSFVYQLNCLILGLEENGQKQLRFRITENRAALKLYAKGAEAKISETLQYTLRLPSDNVAESHPVLEGETEVKLYRIVASRLVGEGMVPLLPTVHILDSSTVFKIYDKPHYIHMSRLSFDTVEILLSTETGKIIPFDGGALVVTLHFRSRRRVDLE
jgi:hypothetical protein